MGMPRTKRKGDCQRELAGMKPGYQLIDFFQNIPLDILHIFQSPSVKGTVQEELTVVESATSR
jgi:hypothetical protein